ncbi:DUF5723 family protein [Croceitalea rosinachiae]|uniref:DUF5723 family protein n=1 Tax=Croceitalea rosinachiae TaxID=3075596 RepID=A0ABU3AGA6_9FLAO|nr:DUF5723 family protein [Croceitalea sp. F388]MDT0607921.1 DUF5723 family protein [Croceitalea sp. F388]
MKNVKLVLFVILMGMAVSHAQNKQLLYDFYEIPQSLILNPGVKTPYKWHTGIPVLSGFSFQVGTSGVTVNDLFAEDGIDFTTKFRDKVINSLSQNDDFGYSGQLEIFNAGFRSVKNPKDYYSFGAYGEGFASIFWPKDLAILAFEGNANNLNRRFDFNDLSTQGEAVSVLHFGINRKVNDKWTIGARAKIYSSVYEFKSTSNSGYFVTTQGEDNILRNTVVADVTMRTSGVEEILDIIDDDTGSTQADLAKLLLSRSLFGGNLGLGFDLGFTHKLNENSFLTASLLDLGFIYHTKDIKNYTLNGAASNEGIEIRLPEDLTNLSNDIWQDLVDDFERLIPFETNDESYISLRPIKLNVSYRYNFGQQRDKPENCDCGIKPVNRTENFDYKNALGAHLFVINRPRGPQAALTAFYQKRLGKVLALKTTYTADKYTLTNIGLGLNLQVGPINFYILGDNLLGYQNIPASNYASLQFGFNIISWNGN